MLLSKPQQACTHTRTSHSTTCTGRGLFHFVSQDKSSSMRPTSSQQPLQLLLACLCFLGLLLLLPVATATSTGSSVASVTTKSSSSCSISSDAKKKSVRSRGHLIPCQAGRDSPTPPNIVTPSHFPVTHKAPVGLWRMSRILFLCFESQARIVGAMLPSPHLVLPTSRLLRSHHTLTAQIAAITFKHASYRRLLSHLSNKTNLLFGHSVLS